MAPTKSAVLIAVPEAQTAVGAHRSRFDPSATWGVPPHVTVLYPFVRPEEIDDDVLAKLGAAIASVPSFDTVFARTAWFGDDVLYLAPEQDAPFCTLMTAVWEAFGALPPYGGGVPDVTPHLTIGHDAPRTALQKAAEDVAAHLPIPVRVSSALLMAGCAEPDSWRTVATFPLALALEDRRF
ncbi:MAG: 2'-5' RNA ligase family protein [Mycobacterium sp.]